MGKRRAVEYPCGVCHKTCESGGWSVFCDACQLWFHCACEDISQDQRTSLEQVDRAFLCTSCTHSSGHFDFVASLKRLGEAALQGTSGLGSAIQLEEILLRKTDKPQAICDVTLGTRHVDRVAAAILERIGGIRGFHPVSVTADGNCLFNALSVAAFGSEQCSNELRVRSAIDLWNHQDEYAEQLGPRGVRLVSPDIEEAVVDCATSGSFSSAWTMQAAANVLGRVIVSTFPPLNGILDQCVKILDTTFRPRGRDTGASLHIMWTSMSLPTSGTWTPNHFVPLLSSTAPVTITLSQQEIPTSSMSRRTKLPDVALSPIDTADDPMFCYDRDEVTDSSASTETETAPRSSTPKAMDTSSEKNRTGTRSHNSEEFDPLPTEGKFMTIGKVLEVIKSQGYDTLNSVPLGKKNNVFFVIENSGNVEKWKANSHAKFADDCGVWDSKKGSTANIYLVLDGAGYSKTLHLKNGLFCTESRVRGKTAWVPLDPQPAEDSLLKMHRYYATLKCDPNYKKRISCVTGLDYPHVAVVEYCGTRSVVESVHGNSKKKKRYTRTEPEVLRKIGEEVKSKPPREVYKDMVGENSFEAPRNFKQVRDKKYNDQKKARQDYRSNVADEVLSVIGMLEENSNVRRIVMDKGKSPCVILYSNDQLEDLKRNLVGGSVLGVDRTFNLGACYVTTTVYKNASVTHSESGENPIFLGPMFLHWDGEFDTYHVFFSHLQAKLFDIVCDIEIKIGSDQEQALIKAIRCCFPSATHILCTKHLKDNVSRYLCDKVGCSVNVRNTIVHKIFGKNGLTSSTDRFLFEKRSLALEEDFQDYPMLKAYFEKLKPLLFEYVCKPYQSGNFPKLWTNNNCESMNNILKLTLNWKPQKLPELVEKLCSVSTLQMLDFRRSLYGSGNYTLVPKLKKYSVPRESWVKKSDDEKKVCFRDFLQRKKCIQDGRVQATNVKFSIPQTSRIAKKPCQRKRTKSERAR